MAALGQVLAGLTDPASRQRVLNWAAERFGADGVQPMAEPSQSPDRVTFDPALNVGSLDDMFPAVFEDVNDDLAIFEQSEPETSRPSIEVVIRSFAADFQRFTEEWNGANA